MSRACLRGHGDRRDQSGGNGGGVGQRGFDRGASPMAGPASQEAELTGRPLRVPASGSVTTPTNRRLRHDFRSDCQGCRRPSRVDGRPGGWRGHRAQAETGRMAPGSWGTGDDRRIPSRPTAGHRGGRHGQRRFELGDWCQPAGIRAPRRSWSGGGRHPDSGASRKGDRAST